MGIKEVINTADELQERFYRYMTTESKEERAAMAKRKQQKDKVKPKEEKTEQVSFHENTGISPYGPYEPVTFKARKARATRKTPRISKRVPRIS